jgi:hypothetical protein
MDSSQSMRVMPSHYKEGDRETGEEGGERGREEGERRQTKNTEGGGATVSGGSTLALPPLSSPPFPFPA